jgi:hypothetical protein
VAATDPSDTPLNRAKLARIQHEVKTDERTRLAQDAVELLAEIPPRHHRRKWAITNAYTWARDAVTDEMFAELYEGVALPRPMGEDVAHPEADEQVWKVTACSRVCQAVPIAHPLTYKKDVGLSLDLREVRLLLT